jgi:hypothetical protein
MFLLTLVLSPPPNGWISHCTADPKLSICGDGRSLDPEASVDLSHPVNVENVEAGTGEGGASEETEVYRG